MSLRQRGQRPSEATNEGGYYAVGGGVQNQQQQQQQPPSYNNTNNQTPQQQMPRRPSPPSSGGYPGASGYYGAQQQPTIATTTPSAGGYAGYNNNNNQTTTPIMQQPAVQHQASYPNTAPPAYNQHQQQYSSGGYNNNHQPAQQQQQQQGGVAINLHSSGYGGGGTSYGGGYNNNSYATNMGGVSSNNNAANPYQKKSSSSGFTLKHILLSILTLTLIVLTGTTYHYRNIMYQTEIQLNIAKSRQKSHEFRKEKRDIQQKKKKEKKKLYGNKDGGVMTNDKKDNLKSQINAIQQQITNQQNEYNDNLLIKKQTLQTTLDDLLTKKQDYLKTIDHTENLLQDAKEDSNKYKAMVDGMEEMETYMKKREGALWSRVNVLESKIGRESRRETEEWFGPGPYHVEIELEYPKVSSEEDPSTWPLIRNTLTIELAPLDLMPHTVNLFLQQVHHQLWDGCRVVTNQYHIFQIGPSYHEDSKQYYPHYDNFYKRGMDKVAFQEYSPEYPHVQWTVGLAGRPGGPDFYINKIDNTHTHGPGGQPNEEDLHNEADPCFGKLVNDSHKVLEEIDLIPLDPERGNEMKYPVVVISAKVLTSTSSSSTDSGGEDGGWKEVKAGEKSERDGDKIMPLPDVPHGV